MGKQKHFRTPEQVEFADLLKASGLKGAEIARRMGITRSSISRILGGHQNPSPMALASLKRIVEDINLGPRDTPKVTGALVLKESEIGEVHDTRRIIPGGQLAPVVSWAVAGSPGFDPQDLANQTDEVYPTDCRDPNCFWLQVENDSMIDEVKPGDYMLLAPNSEAVNGRIVAAKLSQERGVLCKLYHRNGDMIRLTSFNPAYPMLEYRAKDFDWIYPMHVLMRKPRPL